MESSLAKACFSVISMILIVSFSGCTMPDFGFGGGDTIKEGVMSAELSSDLTRVRSDDYTNLYLTVGNPSTYDQYTQNTYTVKAKIISLGIFDSSSDTDEQEQDMLGVKQKSFAWRLNTPTEVSADTPTTVTAQLEVNKEIIFTMPSILFATKDAEAAAETRSNPLPGGPKNLYFNDNFINVEVDLNQQPPVIQELCLDGEVGGNVKFTPIMPGTINIDSLEVDDGSCTDIDNMAKTAYCTFNCDTDSVTDKKFKLTVSYTYRLIKDYAFTIYPY
jgi:hypothetical protein